MAVGGQVFVVDRLRLALEHLPPVAAGAGQSYFGNDRFAEFAPGMKTLDDALEDVPTIVALLVDDPVVAGDAIKRELQAGQPPIIAAWLGPTKLATAILFFQVALTFGSVSMGVAVMGLGED